MAADAVTLWALPASHPVLAVQRALELKGIAFKRVDLLPVMHRAVLRASFPGMTVPAVRLASGERVQGSRAILRRLDELVPDPPLRPADPAARAEADRAEEWGDQVLQPIARRLAWWGLGERPDAMASYLDGIRTVPPAPAPVAARTAPLVARMSRKLNGVDEPAIRADLTHLPMHLDRVDRWIALGVLGGEQTVAADLQVASSLRLLQTFADLAPIIDPRPAGALARRWFPAWTGGTPRGAFPPSWLPAG